MVQVKKLTRIIEHNCQNILNGVHFIKKVVFAFAEEDNSLLKNAFTQLIRKEGGIAPWPLRKLRQFKIESSGNHQRLDSDPPQQP